MKRLLFVALVTVAVVGLSTGTASAGMLFNKCACCCSCSVQQCFIQPNAFSPACPAICGGHCCHPYCLPLGCPPPPPCCPPPCCAPECPPDCCADGSCAAHLPGAGPGHDNPPLMPPPTAAPTPGFQAPMPHTPAAAQPYRPLPQGSSQAAYNAAYRYPYGYGYPGAMPAAYNPAAMAGYNLAAAFRYGMYPAYGHNYPGYSYPGYGYNYGTSMPNYWTGGR